jgi:hypothetical protein
MKAILQIRAPENFRSRRWGADLGARTPIGVSGNLYKYFSAETKTEAMKLLA